MKTGEVRRPSRVADDSLLPKVEIKVSVCSEDFLSEAFLEERNGPGHSNSSKRKGIRQQRSASSKREGVKAAVTESQLLDFLKRC